MALKESENKTSNFHLLGLLTLHLTRLRDKSGLVQPRTHSLYEVI